MLVVGTIEQVDALSVPPLMIVANAVAGVPPVTERLNGSTAATRTTLLSAVFWTKVAVTVSFRTSEKGPQFSMPLQSMLLQPAKVEPLPATAAKVTCVPCGKLTLQVFPQLIPVGSLVTVPAPVPVLATVS